MNKESIYKILIVFMSILLIAVLIISTSELQKGKNIINQKDYDIDNLSKQLTLKTNENNANINRLSTISASINNLITYDNCYGDYCSGSPVYNINTKETYVLVYISDNTAHVITTSGDTITLDASLLRHK